MRRRECGLYGPTFARIVEHRHSVIGGHLEEHGLPNSALEVIINILLKREYGEMSCFSPISAVFLFYLFWQFFLFQLDLIGSKSGSISSFCPWYNICLEIFAVFFFNELI